MEYENFKFQLAEMEELAYEMAEEAKKGIEKTVGELKSCWNDETGKMFTAKISEISEEIFTLSVGIAESVEKIKRINE